MLKPPTGRLPEILAAKDYNLQPEANHPSNRSSSQVTPADPNGPAPSSLPPSDGAVPGASDEAAANDKHFFRRFGAPDPAPRVASAAKGRTPLGLKQLKLYQILLPAMAYRGRVFGSKLALKDEWVALDSSFFEAPGDDLGGRTISMVMSLRSCCFA